MGNAIPAPSWQVLRSNLRQLAPRTPRQGGTGGFGRVNDPEGKQQGGGEANDSGWKVVDRESAEMSLPSPAHSSSMFCVFPGPCSHRRLQVPTRSQSHIA